MNRHEKEKAISVAKDLFSGSQAVFIVNYKGLSVSGMQALRKNLRQNGGRLKVIKVTLMDLATRDLSGIEDFRANFKDQVGFVFAKNEPSGVAKQLVNFSKENESLKIITGIFESKVLDLSQIKTMASLPSREVLLAHLLGTMKAPISAFARVLNQISVVNFPESEKHFEENKGSSN
jgi:large subunit ribosomal protein L10